MGEFINERLYITKAQMNKNTGNKSRFLDLPEVLIEGTGIFLCVARKIALKMLGLIFLYP